MQFDPAKWKARIAEAASIMDVSNVSLEKFKAKGGKVVGSGAHHHRRGDPSTSPRQRIARVP
jgi:hypothetical protein